MAIVYDTLDLAPPNQQNLGNVYTQGDFTFTNSVVDPNAIVNWVAFGAPQYAADRINSDLLFNFPCSTTTLTSSKGAFNIESIAFANGYNTLPGDDDAITVNAFLTNGTTVSKVFNLANKTGFQDDVLNFQNVQYLTFAPDCNTSNPDNCYIQADRLKTFMSVSMPSTVPLPSAAPMMGGALLLAAAVPYAAKKIAGKVAEWANKLG